MDEGIINVQMLGDFSISIDGKAFQLERNNSTKATQLLQYLLYFRDKKVPRETLMKMLYADEDIADPANNLKVNLFRLRKLLASSNLPGENYIIFKSGHYCFSNHLKINVDAEQFEAFINESNREGISIEDKKLFLQKAIELYKGEFLPMISTAPWVVIENARYENLYLKCVKKLCELLTETREFTVQLNICNKAINIYPFNEDLRLAKIACFVNMKQFNGALVAYEETTRFFFEELGISPSEKMLSLYKQMTSGIKLNTSSLEQIREILKETTNSNGAYYCNFLSFLDSYRYISRVIERFGQSIYLSLYTLTNIQGEPMEVGDKLDESVEFLQESICTLLRRGDLYTRYSHNQFIVLLIGINLENCALVSDRIVTYFLDNKKVRGVRVKHNAISGTELDSGFEEHISFSKKPIW